jgi:DNA-binding transcriptional LysR family regulator
MLFPFRVYRTSLRMVYPEPIMRSLHPLDHVDSDWFCKHVLPELTRFFEAATTGKLQSAGEKLGKTRQGIGKSSQKIERALSEWFSDVSLRDRSHPKTFRPTEAGEALVRFAEDVLARMEQFMDEMQHLQNGGEVRVATIYAPWLTYGAQVEAAFKERMANASVNLRLITGPKYMDKITTEVREGRADVGITSYPPKVAPPLALTRMPEHPMVLIFPTKYRRLPKEKEVKLQKVISDDPDLKIVIFQRSFDVPVTNRVIAYVRACEADLGPSQRIEVDNLSQAKDLLLTLPGTIGILPELAVRNEVAKGWLKAYRLDPPMQLWTWGIIHREETSKPAVRHFLDCLIRIAKG